MSSETLDAGGEGSPTLRTTQSRLGTPLVATPRPRPAHPSGHPLEAGPPGCYLPQQRRQRRRRLGRGPEPTSRSLRPRHGRHGGNRVHLRRQGTSQLGPSARHARSRDVVGDPWLARTIFRVLSGVVVGATRRTKSSEPSTTRVSNSGSAPSGKSVARRPSAPASAASLRKVSMPRARIGSSTRRGQQKLGWRVATGPACRAHRPR